MVKNIILSLSLLALAACSGKGTDVELKVSKSFAIAAQNGGGAVLYISNDATKEKKTIVVESEEVKVTLLNGTWDFSVVSWNGTTSLSGDLSCAKQSAVLSGQKVEIDLDPTLNECQSSNFSQKEVSFVNCHSLSGITAGETCDGVARGQAGSYQIHFENSEGKSLRSACIKAPGRPLSMVETNLSLPFNYIKDFRFDLFSDSSCSSGKKTYSHLEALSDNGVFYFAYGEKVNSQPVAANVLPPDVMSYGEINVSLSYTDADLDLATSCEISELQNLTVTTPCSCTLGACSVGVMEISAHNNVSFNYRVFAGGQFSNFASASFYVFGDSTPDVDVAPVAQGIADGGTMGFGPFSYSLPYYDQNGDEATSCEIVSHSPNIISSSCACSTGICSAAFEGQAYGAASFEYKVTAKNLDSNTATVLFNLIGTPEFVHVPSTIHVALGEYVDSGIIVQANNSPITCTISPALPSGLALNASDCNITGMASALLSSFFTITASNLAGSVSATTTISIYALPPTIDYTTALNQDFYKDESLIIVPVINDNGYPIINCTISPALPAGLSINNSNCVIQGIPSLALNNTYTVTALNAGGVVDVSIQLKIESPFITKWQIAASNESITLPIVSGVPYNFRVDWGDGTDSIITTSDSPDRVHVYSAAGTYTVKIYGQFPQIKFYGSGQESKIMTVEQWGTTKWKSMEHAFAYCSNLQIMALDKPDLSQTQSLSAMFMNATNFNSDISHWDTHTITNMSYMFKYASTFNQPIGTWNTSNVTNMSYMFSNATAFNRPLGDWNTQSVTNMEAMFEKTPFNQPIGNWNTSNVTNMSMMFLYAASFNQPIGTWDTSKVTNFNSMFSNATKFNHPLSTWDVSSAQTYDFFDNGTNYLWTSKPLF